MTNEQVIAGIDGSSFSTSVCDYAAWAATRLDAPLTDMTTARSEGWGRLADLLRPTKIARAG